MSILDGLILDCNTLPTKTPVKKPPFFRSSIIPEQNWDELSQIKELINLGRGPWLAGGAVLSWFNGIPITHGDIDIFMSHDSQEKEIGEKLRSFGNYPIYETNNAVTYSNGQRNITFQVIRSFKRNSLDELLESFDTPICKIATDGHKFYIGDKRFLHHNNSKILHFDRIECSTVKRLVKYFALGYTPSQDQVQQIVNSYINSDNFGKTHTDDAYENFI